MLPPSPAQVPVSKVLSWKMAYFYDEDSSALSLHDVHYPGPGCIVALGVQSVRGKAKPVSLRSADRGKTWSITTMRQFGRSAFFLNERLGWVVTEDGLERTADCGASFEKTGGGQKGLVRVWFRDEAWGWAVGAPRKAVVTRDGGKSWKPLDSIKDEPGPAADRSVYAWVEFANDTFGVITGWHTPQRRDRQPFPVWMDPESAGMRRQLPSLTLMLQTLDGGLTWQGFTASLMGRLTRVRTAPDGAGLALIEFDESFEYPSEIYELGAGQKDVRRVYREQRHAVTDLALARDGWVYLAGVEVPGALRLPVPGRLHIVRTRRGDTKTIVADPVDYRATANRVAMALSPSGQAIAVTDTGMVLRLE
jgi:hypothetical protein